MNANKANGLPRGRFLSLLAKSALGLWLLQMIPAVNLKSPGRRKKTAPANRYAALVQTHPQAVKREKRG